MGLSGSSCLCNSSSVKTVQFWHSCTAINIPSKCRVSKVLDVLHRCLPLSHSRCHLPKAFKMGLSASSCLAKSHFGQDDTVLAQLHLNRHCECCVRKVLHVLRRRLPLSHSRCHRPKASMLGLLAQIAPRGLRSIIAGPTDPNCQLFVVRKKIQLKNYYY